MKQYRLMRLFQKNDETMLPSLHKIHREDEDAYISMYQKHTADLEKLLQLDSQSDTREFDKAWTATDPEK